VIRWRARHDRVVEPYGQLRDAPQVVTTPDGVELYLEIDGELRGEAPLTIVFCHGYALTQDSWHYQRRDLGSRGKPLGRLVFYDQRGHGRSGRGARDTATLEQLSVDLAVVLDAVAPRSPVVLVGHSLGGMVIMALADQYPELFGNRVVGVALLATSPGQWAKVTLGVPIYGATLLHRLLPRFLAVLSSHPELVEKGWRAASGLGHVLTRRCGFASDVPLSLVKFTAEMLAATPIDVIADFYPAFAAHDKLRALPILRRVETLVLIGENDLLTPVDHGRVIAQEVPGATLVLMPSAGHQLILEHPDVVNHHLRELVARVSQTLECDK